MSSAARHYDALLAPHYVWMSGMTLEEKVFEQQTLLDEFGIGGRRIELAIDLGCGPGYQAIALARLGCRRVMAVDTSRCMLAQLAAARDALPIDLVHADLRMLDALARGRRPEVIVCMGDTITHLESRQEVSRLIAAAHGLLAPDGLLVLTFRDLCAELQGIDRFIPVRADDERIVTCVLEYEAETVVVNDLVHVRDGSSWIFHASSYRKLRLAPAALADELAGAGFAVARREIAGGLHAILARKEERA